MEIKTSNENRKNLLKMLAWIELCGIMNHNSSDLKISIQGESCKIKFKFNTLNEQEEFNGIKQDLIKSYNVNNKDFNSINLK